MTTKKILLVEDDKSLREIYGVRLLAEGYDIVSASDGEEALAKVIKERPHLIISDVMMPKISGFDMLDILRSTTETRDVKVIMMTALSSEDQRERGKSLGADRYLVKSQVGIEDVVRAVHEVLGDNPNKVVDGIQANQLRSHAQPSTSTAKQPNHATTHAVSAPAIQSAAPTKPYLSRSTSLGERVIHPLTSSMPKPDYASLINDELSTEETTPSTLPTPPTDPGEPQPFTLPPSKIDDTLRQSESTAPTRTAKPQAPLINDIIATTPQNTKPSAVPEVKHSIVAHSAQPAEKLTTTHQTSGHLVAQPDHIPTPADDEAELAKALHANEQQATTNSLIDQPIAPSSSSSLALPTIETEVSKDDMDQLLQAEQTLASTELNTPKDDQFYDRPNREVLQADATPNQPTPHITTEASEDLAATLLQPRIRTGSTQDTPQTLTPTKESQESSVAVPPQAPLAPVDQTPNTTPQALTNTPTASHSDAALRFEET